MTISPDMIAESASRYSITTDEETIWAPYTMNRSTLAPSGEVISIPGAGKSSPENFQVIARHALDLLLANEPTAPRNQIRHTLVDGSLPLVNGVDCSGFAYFALKGCGVAIDSAIKVSPKSVIHAANWAKWHQDDPKLTSLVEQASDRALDVGSFTNLFYDEYQPEKSVNVASFDASSHAITHYEAQSGDIALFQTRASHRPSHIAIVQRQDENGDITLVHSGSKGGQDGLGGVETFTKTRKYFSTIRDYSSRVVTFKRINW